MEKVKPLSKAEALELLPEIPSIIIDAVNCLLKKKFPISNGKCKILQDEILELVVGCPEDGKLSKDMIFENHWLDFEPIFRKAGWKVSYDKPGYDESYKAFFIFE